VRADPPYRIETERLVVRCWEPRDAPLLKEAVDASLDHLRPWMHTRFGDDAFEIGYWIRASRAGRGLATEVTAALTRVALELCGADRVEIRVDPANEASLAVPRKLGFAEEATLRRRLPNPDGEPRDVTLFVLFHDDLGGAVASARFEAYDALGRHLR
jgi:hypothetical protein